MKRLLVRRGAVGLTLGALAATGLASVASPAHAVITNADIYTSTYFNDSECPFTASAPSPANVLISDNNVPVTATHSVSGTSTNGGNPADITDFSATSSLTTTVSPMTGGPATITAVGTVSARAMPRLATTECNGYAQGYARSEGDFVLTQPMWATITATGTGSGSGYAEIWSESGGDLYVNTANRTSGAVTALIPAGDANFYFNVTAEGDSDSSDPRERAENYSASFKIDLQPVGAATAATGKGASYAVFGGRDCVTGNVPADITKKAKKKAKQVVITVNGAKVAKFKGKKLKKRALVLPAAPASAAEVVATIKLKNGKKVTVTRSYLACS